MTSKKKIVILVNGLVGAGKSVLCEKISEHYKLKYYPTSGVLRNLMEKELKQKHVDITKNTGFWESEEGKKFLSTRLKDTSFDKKLDKYLLELVEKGGIVLDSWVMPWISKKGYKIWLTASDDIRFRRVAGRDIKKLEEAKERSINKEKKTIAIYKKAYGFTWGKNLEVFDLIINTDNLTEKEVFEKAKNAIDKHIKKN